MSVMADIGPKYRESVISEDGSNNQEDLGS